MRHFLSKTTISLCIIKFLIFDVENELVYYKLGLEYKRLTK